MVDVDPGANTPFRISPDPFYIDRDMLEQLEAIGPHLLRFYVAANRLYAMSVRGTAPGWVSHLLERGKSERVIDYQRMRRFRNAVPAIIRPDVIPTDDGLMISELDSVPGGFGLLAAISEQYTRLGYRLVGGENGIPLGFWDAVTDGMAADLDPLVALVVSDESESYRGEMTWLTRKLNELGHRAKTVHPSEVYFQEEADEEALFIHENDPGKHGGVDLKSKVDVLYRFFELFDLKNIPKIDLILYAIRKGGVRATPPIKSNLEEKLLFALLHHDELLPFWKEHLGVESYDICRKLFPQTWILDPTPVPPHAHIPGLQIGGVPIRDYRNLGEATQKERELVAKPSGYSPNAWGSRGVMIGHDMAQEEWSAGIDHALQSFDETPHILQRFHNGSRFPLSYYDFSTGTMKEQPSRARLCPYYFVVDGRTRLGGILATCTPLEKKVIHGMSEAIMVPVAVKDQ